MEYPRLLVISNNSFSKSNSNGRTLGSLLKGWPKDRIAQFCISSDGADFDVCDNYYCVTDGDVLRSTLRLREAASRKLRAAEDGREAKVKDSKGIGKTTFSMLVRNALWNLGVWRGKAFEAWVKEVAPEVILLQSGDSYFMHRLAMRLAKDTGARVATFNTEGYYFFNHDCYTADGPVSRMLNPLYRWLYRRTYRRYMGQSRANVYGNDVLLYDHEAAFGWEVESRVCYTVSELAFEPAGRPGNPPSIAYLGNLGIRRPEALAEAAAVVRSLWPDGRIDVYGNARPADRALLESTPGIAYHGMVAYDEVVRIMRRTDILLHVEKRDPVLLRELRYAFSTKIADSICSGRNFVIYAPAELACSQYAMKTGAARHASTPEELRGVLAGICSNDALRLDVLERARQVAAANHSAAANRLKFKEIICSCAK